MNPCHDCPEAQSLGQLRVVLWSMRKLIDAAQAEERVGRSFLFELRTLADAGVVLADYAMDGTPD